MKTTTYQVWLAIRPDRIMLLETEDYTQAYIFHQKVSPSELWRIETAEEMINRAP